MAALSRRYVAVLGFLAGMVFTIVILLKLDFFPEHSIVHELPMSDTTCGFSSVRVGGYKYIRPLLFAEGTCESARLAPFKELLFRHIEEMKKTGILSDASVYLREFDSGGWTSINDNQTYHPGSLFKVPILMTYLRMAERQDGLLDKKILFEKPANKVLPEQNYAYKSIEEGKLYTVRELLRYAISESDNKATWLLEQHLDVATFESVYIDHCVGIPQRDPADNRVQMTARSYSNFMKSLLNASYLRPENSEFALSLMGESRFKDGFSKGFPGNTRMAHKFGEWDNTEVFELHESGIVYLKDKPFLITIMTRGNKRETLPGAISRLSRCVYEEMGNP